MKLLLDTCCIIWAVSEPDSLSDKAKDLLENEESEIFFSPISVAEIAIASKRGRLELDRHWRKWSRYYTEMNRWQAENIDLDIIEEAYSLPDRFHADPADRIITATARIRRLILLTADRKILSYPHVEAVW